MNFGIFFEQAGFFDCVVDDLCLYHDLASHFFIDSVIGRETFKFQPKQTSLFAGVEAPLPPLPATSDQLNREFMLLMYRSNVITKAYVINQYHQYVHHILNDVIHEDLAVTYGIYFMTSCLSHASTIYIDMSAIQYPDDHPFTSLTVKANERIPVNTFIGGASMVLKRMTVIPNRWEKYLVQHHNCIGIGTGMYINHNCPNVRIDICEHNADPNRNFVEFRSTTEIQRHQELRVPGPMCYG